MRIVIERDFVSRSINIYVIGPNERGYLIDKGPGEFGRTIEHVDSDLQSGRAEPYITFKEDVFDSIVHEAVREMHPEDATVDALKDARVVRDRLLTLIESHAGRS